MVNRKVSRERELWAIALHVESNYGSDGPRFIAERIGKYAMADDLGGVDLWSEVARRYAEILAK